MRARATKRHWVVVIAEVGLAGVDHVTAGELAGATTIGPRQEIAALFHAHVIHHSPASTSRLASTASASSASSKQLRRAMLGAKPAGRCAAPRATNECVKAVYGLFYDTKGGEPQSGATTPRVKQL